MIRICAILLVLGLGASQAQAGAWPREKGTFFVSSDLRLSWPQDFSAQKPTGEYYGTYAEYGLSDRLTLGLDLGRSESGVGKTVAFLRLPLPGSTEQFKIAAELGLGRMDRAPVLRPGLALGRAFQWRDAYGWLALDTLAEIRIDSGRTDYKMDLTVGLTMPEGRKYMMQIQSGAPALYDPYVRIAPSVLFPLGKSRLLEIGASYGLEGDETIGIKLGLWQHF
ncbi:hypothetical protein ACOXXX_10175 [Thalassococcus sp. BH17M4-6]|uniref:hypothetical protein n=1 Tax=Thalassococcus sp. BH17M4-6 TaxID=3413148 RepID=UPI003BEC0DCC